MINYHKETILYISKISLHLLIVNVLTLQLLLAGGVNAQNMSKVRVAIDYRATTLFNTLELIEQQTAFVFAYDSQLDDVSVDLEKAEQVTVKNVLQSLAQQTNLHFKQLDWTIYIKKKEEQKIRKTSVVIAKVISGLVKDENNEPLIGATVLEKGTTNGTITDINGRFEFSIADDARLLQVSFVGYKTQTISVGLEANLEIVLRPDIQNLNEVVVVGYTSKEQKDITGAISVIDAEKIASFPVSSAESLLQGQVSGIQVSTTGGPGDGVAVRIRGYGTVGDNDPLYVIDGVPTKANLNLINPNDIESMQVLKDAAATSIYGARAANGVVIITTKKGTFNESKFTVDGYYGVQQVNNLPEMVNTEQWGELLFAAQLNDGIVPSNQVYGPGPDPVIPNYLVPGLTDGDSARSSVPGTDWFDELFDPATIQYYNIGYQGGTENLRAALSASIFTQEGTMAYTDFKRYSLRINTEYKSKNELIRIGENLSYTYSDRTGVTSNQALGSAFANALRMHPIVPVYNENGGFFSGIDGVRGADNPVALNFYGLRDDSDIRNRIFGNTYFELQLIKNLKLKTDFGLDYTLRTDRNINYAFVAGDAEQEETFLSRTQANTINWVWNNTLNYSYSSGDHLFRFLAGTEAIKFDFESFNSSRTGFFSDDIDFLLLSSGENEIQNSEAATEWSLYSFFGQLEYDYKNKYIINATIRRDGSSRFGEGNQYGVFPAFSVGWRITEESFLENRPSFISDIKVRASWGVNGNQEIGDFPTFSTFARNSNNTDYDINGTNNSVVVGFAPTRIGNPDAKWEETTQVNLGLDLILLQDQLLVNLDYFVKNTDDILLQPPTAAVLGQADEPFVNLGKIQNKGLEFQAQYFSKEYGDFSFSIAGNFSIIRNEVSRLDNSIEFLSGLDDNTFSRNLTISRTQVGQPIAMFYGHVVSGIFQTQEEVDAHSNQNGKAIGRLKFADINNDKVIDDNDRTFIGNPHPDLIYGLTLSGKYRRFELSAFFQGVQGVDIFNFTKYYTDFFFDTRVGKSTRLLDAWTPENRDASVPQLSTIDNNNELRSSSYFVEDGSFVRLKNLRIAYNLPKGLLGLSGGQLYLQGQNLFTLTDYSGVDPEVSIVNTNSSRRNLDLGVDRGVYPNPRILTVGFNFSI